MLDNLTPAQEAAKKELSSALITQVDRAVQAEHLLKTGELPVNNTSDSPELLADELDDATLQRISEEAQEQVLILFHKIRHEIPWMEINKPEVLHQRQQAA